MTTIDYEKCWKYCYCYYDYSGQNHKCWTWCLVLTDKKEVPQESIDFVELYRIK